MIGFMRKYGKYPVTVLILAVLVTLLLPAVPVKADGLFTAELKVGYDNKAEMLRYAPFEITVTNNGGDFSGKIQLIAANKVDYNIMYETDFSIAKGEKKTVTFACKVIDNLGKVNIRVTDKKGKVVWSEQKRFIVDTSASRNIDIGVLSDDFAALSYMDNILFYDRETYQTNLVELTTDTFPEDVNCLDMLEVIVISNFSTDILTDEQIEALNIWVNRGGLLIIGTGSNSSKTLSKLNGTVINVKPDKMNRYNTTFATKYYTVLSSGGGNGNYTYMSPYDDEQFLEDFDEYYNNCHDEVVEWLLPDFMENYGIEEYELEDDGSLPDYWEQEFYTFCLETIYELQYGQAPEDTPYYTTVTADVLGFDVDDAEENLAETLYGDSDNGDYEMGYVYRCASGYIAVYGIDFTMNPIPGYEHSSEIISLLIDRYIFKKVVEHFESIQDNGYYNAYLGNTGNTDNYYTRNFLENLSAAPLPPVLFYAVPVLGYMVAILVMYLVNKKKNKTFRLWYWYPVLAVGVAVLIFSVGFSTRIIRPRINSATILELNKPSAIEQNYVAVTTPSNKDCEVDLSNEYDIQLIREVGGFGGDKSDKINYDSYRVAFNRSIDRTKVTFRGNVALSSDQFLLESIYPTERTFEPQHVINVGSGSSAVEELIVKNSTGVDLENAVIIGFEMGSNGNYHDAIVYRVGDWKNGTTADMTAQKFVSGRNRSYSGAIAFNDSEKHIISGILFGSLSDGFITYKNRDAIMSFLVSRIESEVGSSKANVANPENIVFVVGFPKETICREIQFGKKYRNERTEVIVQKFYVNEMKQVKKQ